MIRSRTGPIYLGSFESCPTIFHPYEGWVFWYIFCATRLSFGRLKSWMHRSAECSQEYPA
jgi:hypothetical protein